MTLDEVAGLLEYLKSTGTPGYTPVQIDCGSYLAEVEEVDLAADPEGIVVIWCGDRVD